MSKHISFELDEKLHKEMKMYLFSLEEEKTIKKYITELIQKDLESKSICKEEEFE